MSICAHAHFIRTRCSRCDAAAHGSSSSLTAGKRCASTRPLVSVSRPSSSASCSRKRSGATRNPGPRTLRLAASGECVLCFTVLRGNAHLYPSREWFLHYYALGLKKGFDFINRVPRFVLMIASGAVASFVMRLLHKAPPENPAAARQPAPASTSSKSETGTVVSSTTKAASSTTATSSPSKRAKQRKAGKK